MTKKEIKEFYRLEFLYRKGHKKDRESKVKKISWVDYLSVKEKKRAISLGEKIWGKGLWNRHLERVGGGKL